MRAGLVISLLLVAPLARAQLARPELIEMPEVIVPGDASLARAEIEILVHADGSARIFSCDHDEDLCRRIEHALAHARFAPATRDGAAIPARIRLEARLQQGRLEPAPALPESPYGGEAQLGVVAEVAPIPAGAERVTLEQVRDTPGALGDPFRAILDRPGVVPVLSGLPYFYLRGAPPAGTVYVYDSIPMPALYHLGVGPAVIHPRMAGDVQLHTAIAPARYGGHTGGVVVGEGPAVLARDVEAEAELRALDASGYVRARHADIDLAAAVRFGYPGLLVSAFSPEVDLAYGDYQARAALALGAAGRLELVTLGSYDTLTTVQPPRPLDPGPRRTETRILFQRTELRYVQSRGDVELGLALRAGYDETFFGGHVSGHPLSIGVRLGSFASRAWLAGTLSTLRYRIGGEVMGGAGAFDAGGQAPGDFGVPLVSLIGNARQRTSASVYAQVEWQPSPELRLAGGVRGDLWMTPGRFEGAIDPRLRASWQPLRELELFAGAGVARQPAVFVLPLPGLSELPVQFGLQTAVQSELGARTRLRVRELAVEASATLFVHHYDNLLMPDLLADARDVCVQGLCLESEPSPRADALAYGVEATLRADLGRHVAARAAYTLSWLESDQLRPLAYTPTYDVRHVLHVILQIDTRAGFSAGVRAFLRSGTIQGRNYIDEGAFTLARYEQRLPWFARLDAQVAYAWDAGWADLRLYLEWLNTTFALGGEPQDLDCPSGPRSPRSPCGVERLAPIFAPNLGIRGSFR